jgi:ribosomal protein L7/L12
MLKHIITVEANGITYRVETNADTFTVGGVAFNFQVPAPSSSPATVPVNSEQPRVAQFLGSQTVEKKSACIKAIREASGYDLKTAKECLEGNFSFFVYPGIAKTNFEIVCKTYSLEPLYRP